MPRSTPSSPRGRRHLGRRAVFALVGLAAALVVAVPLAWAAHQFTDVPDANPFHDDISAIAGAGITAGKTCVPPGAPPTYCPGEGITREAMAAFVHRGFGRVGGDFLPIAEVPADVSVPTGWTLDLTAGGVPGNTGFVKIDAEVSIANFGPRHSYFSRISRSTALTFWTTADTKLWVRRHSATSD